MKSNNQKRDLPHLDETDSPNVYFKLAWRNKFLTDDATSIEEMSERLIHAGLELLQMSLAGVVIDPLCGLADDDAVLVTDNPWVAEQFGFTEVKEEDEIEDDRGCCDINLLLDNIVDAEMNVMY